jgi:hypothetical protein
MAWSEYELDKMLVAADFAPLKYEKDRPLAKILFIN